ncbi:MAG: hypothetical protein J6K58_08810 [Lachnospiraceae bacterium]|nr:hypothetical protein [Lachnospiraceae bacterium]
MRNVFVHKSIDIVNILKEYDVSFNSFVSMSIGYDDAVYILLSEKIPERINGIFVDTTADTIYSMLVLSVDWYTGELLSYEYYNLGRHMMNFHFIQPINNRILLLGSRTCNQKEGPEKNAVLVDRSGTVSDEFCLGDGIEDCIVTADGRIITSYFDEGVFGNYGWDHPIGSCGLISWDEKGNILWKADDPIYDCYAMNLDDKGNLWYYYYDEFNLVRTDFHKKVVYQPDIMGAAGFLLTADSGYLIFDGGYDKHSEFHSAVISHHEIKDYERTEIIFQEKPLLIKNFKFRGSKALFLDHKNRLFVKQIVQI